MVYVLNQNRQPLIKVRHLLKDGKVKAVNRCPFTIKLMYQITSFAMSSFGFDAGSKYIDVSVTTEEKVLYEADLELRNNIVDLLSTHR